MQKLNNYIKNILRCFENCEFLDIRTNSTLYNNNNKECCDIINTFIDNSDYDKYYIRGRKLNTNTNKIIKNTNQQSKLKPGTIPYYFNKANKKSYKSTEDKVTWSNKPYTDPNKITHYFPVLKKARNRSYNINTNDQNKEVYPSTSTVTKLGNNQDFFRL